MADYDNGPQLDGPQHEAAQQTSNFNQDATQTEQSSACPGIVDCARPDTIELRPPPPIPRHHNHWFQKTIWIQFGSVGYTWSTEEGEQAFCARQREWNKTITKPKSPRIELGPVFHDRVEPQIVGNQTGTNCIYITVGIMGNETSIPHETLLPVTKDKGLFQQIRKAERELRSPVRRLLSLKRVGGFGIYRCHPLEDYHSSPPIGDETTRCLVELFRNYRTEKRDYQDRWMNWIHENFNNNSVNPKDGKYALQLLLRWSPLKLVIWSSIPIILSLVVGLWYMINPHRGEDYVATVQTAWTIASYIVTTAALSLAILASITQLGD